ncbi:hypothetical protein AVEN_47841-1 [Araneus ventricosus]|uniref:Uncharacterized protein n=1 Tax=Araneus ventricosus TaxID=182803 RepID=A0A4Y2QDN8_ARAVE|nr:hypothetical protein AVEN_47841-1 [Araneus ventricosus]
MAAGETFVNDRKVKGSGQRPQYSYGQLQLCIRSGSVFDHSLFGWSNYDGNKSQTTVVERRNMDLEYRDILFICFRKAYYRERVLFVSSTLPGGPNCFLFKGAHLPSGKLGTSPVRYCSSI